MSWTQQLDRWGEKNHSAFILGFRILLGTILLIKGYLIMFNINDFTEVVRTLGMESFNVTLALIIAWAHLIGGLLITVGLVTRICCLIQLPILIGAVFYANVRQGFINPTEWLISVVILYLVIYFFVRGNGEFSLGNLFAGREGEDAIPSRVTQKDGEVG